MDFLIFECYSYDLLLITITFEAIMLNRQESIAVLGKHFRQKKIATIKDIMLLINAKNNMGVYRRLKEIDYVSSFSNSGMYYTLKTVADFNSSGLSFINEVGFSLYGNLKQTLIHLIEESASGKTHQELEIQLKINLKNSLHNALLDLVRSKKISRIAPSNSHVYLYVSVHENRAKKQISNRNEKKIILEKSELSDWVIVEILSSIIRANQIAMIDSQKIISDLSLRNVILSESQVNEILNKLNLKKTLGYR